MINFLKNNIKIVIGIIIGLTIAGTTAYALTVTSDQITYDNSQSGIEANNVADAIDKLYEKAESSNGKCPEGYIKTNIKDYTYSCEYSNIPLCHRAKTLHTENCNNNSTSWNGSSWVATYCPDDGYTIGSTITYGRLGSGSTLHTGDAFDCDVNGDGIYDSGTERFYYVSDYYDTINMNFDSSYATLIYYKDTSTSAVKYSTSSTYYSGPTTAMGYLPSKTQWSNVTLKTSSRNLLFSSDGTTVEKRSSYNTISYSTAARLLTFMELKKGCPSVGIGITLGTCRFLLENTKYASSSATLDGSWLETVCSNSNQPICRSSASYHKLDSMYNYQDASNGARPAIDVPKSMIKLQ